MTWAPAFLSNPERFMAFSRWAAPMFGVIAAGLAAWGLARQPAFQLSMLVFLMGCVASYAFFLRAAGHNRRT